MPTEPSDYTAGLPQPKFRRIEPSDKPKWNPFHGAQAEHMNGKWHGLEHPADKLGMAGGDELAKRWGAWGGDRKLSPRFRPLPEPRSSVILSTAIIFGCMILMILAFLWELFCA
jgi:hypothetical protein